MAEAGATLKNCDRQTFKDSDNNVFVADYNKSNYFDTDLRKCVVKSCIVY